MPKGTEALVRSEFGDVAELTGDVPAPGPGFPKPVVVIGPLVDDVLATVERHMRFPCVIVAEPGALADLRPALLMAALPHGDAEVVSTAAGAAALLHVLERAAARAAKTAANDEVIGQLTRQIQNATNHPPQLTLRSLGNLAEHAPLGIALVSGKGEVIAMNRPGYGMLGVEQVVEPGWSFMDAFEDRATISDVLQGVLTGLGGEIVTLTTSVGDDQRRRFLTISMRGMTPVEHDEVVLVIVEDVTPLVTASRRRAEALRDQARIAEKLRLVTRAGFLGLIERTSGSDRIAATPIALALHGFPPGTVVTTVSEMIEHVHPGDHDAFSKLFADGGTVDGRADYRVRIDSGWRLLRAESEQIDVTGSSTIIVVVREIAAAPDG